MINVPKGKNKNNLADNVSIVHFNALFQPNYKPDIKLYEEGGIEILYIDDFYENIDAIYDYATKCHYSNELDMTQAAPVLRSRIYTPVYLLQWIENISQVFRTKGGINVEHEVSDFQLYDSRMNYWYQNQEPHHDNEQYMWIIYLTDDGYGTEFFETTNKLKKITGNANSFKSERLLTGRFNKILSMPGKKNRMILFDANNLHKQGIKEGADFNSRIIQIGYFHYGTNKGPSV